MWRSAAGLTLCVVTAISLTFLLQKDITLVKPPTETPVVEPEPIPTPEPTPTPIPEPLPEPFPNPAPFPADDPPKPRPLPPPEPEPAAVPEVADGRKVYVTATEAELATFVATRLLEQPDEEPYQHLGFVLSQSRLGVSCPPEEQVWLVPWDFYLKHLMAKKEPAGVPDDQHPQEP